MVISEHFKTYDVLATIIPGSILLSLTAFLLFQNPIRDIVYAGSIEGVEGSTELSVLIISSLVI